MDVTVTNYDTSSFEPDIFLTEASLEQNIDPNSLMVDIEAIHALPYATRNYTRYTDKCLKNSVPGWTKPYNRPLIRHHNEKDGNVIGRVISASYKSNNTFSNTPALVLTVNVPDERAKNDIKNGIDQTVSIGVIATDVRCSICGKPIELDDNGDVISCDHKRGQVYDKETAYWDVHAMNPKEVSYVIVPSDIFAGNIRSYPATKNKATNFSESYEEEREITNMDMKEMETKLKTAEDESSKLKDGIKALSDMKESLEGQLKEVSSKLESSDKQLSVVQSENVVLKNKIETIEAQNTEFNTKINDLNDIKKDLEDKLNDELKMKEGLESELTAIKVSLKEALIDNLQYLRQINGKIALDKDQLINREESSIRDSIADLKLEMKESSTVQNKPGSVPNPTLSEEADDKVSDNKISTKESASSTDLRAELENIFIAVAGARK